MVTLHRWGRSRWNREGVPVFGVALEGPSTVATTLVERGDLLQAQHRLGHRDASTTLRTYSHALPLTDADAALDQLYRVSTDS